MFYFLLLFFLFELVAGNTIYNVTQGNSSVTIECNRYYQSEKGTCANPTYVWDGIQSQYPFGDLTLDNGLKALRDSCEIACADLHDCKGYSVSTAVNVLSGNIHCNLYLNCETVVAGTTDLFIRQAPFKCFVLATTSDGVFKNFNDNAQPYVQLSRLLEVEVQPFQDIHFMVNGAVHKSAVSIQVYKELGDFCESDDSVDCLFLYSGLWSVLSFSTFVILVGINVFLIISKKNMI